MYKFLGSTKAHELRPMNTWFTKPPEKLATYREMCKAEECTNTGPFTTETYAVLDHFITKEKRAKSVKDVETDLKTGFDSAHFLMKAKVEVCLEYRQKFESDRAERYYKPKNEAWEKYNRMVQEALETTLSAAL